MTYHIPGIIPAELRHSRILHLQQQSLLALVQGIQPHENEAAAMRPGLGKHGIHALRPGFFRDRTAYHSLISLSPGAQQGIEILIDIQEYVPYFPEGALRVASAALHQVVAHPCITYIEAVHKAQYRFPLGIAEVLVAVLQGLQVRDVGKYRLGIDQVLVYVVEIREDDVSPVDKLVQAFGLGIMLFVAGVEVYELAYAVRRDQA